MIRLPISINILELLGRLGLFLLLCYFGAKNSDI